MAINGFNFEPVVTVPIRPLSLGIVPDTPTQGVPVGGVLNMEHYYPTEKGITHFEGEILIQSDATIDIPYPPVVGFLSYWQTDGSLKTILIDSKFVYNYNYVDGITRKVEEFDNTGTATVSGTTVTLATAMSERDVLPGDLFSADSTETEVVSITSTTVFELASSPGDDVYASGTWEVLKSFYSGEAPDTPTDYIPLDYVIADNLLLLADGRRGVRQYDASTDLVTEFCSLRARTIEYARDRIYLGNIAGDTSNFERQVIRWSEVGSGNLDDFPDENYLALPYVRGEIVKLKHHGDYLLAFFEDSLWYGTPTNYPSLPYQFRQLESGNKGVAGKKAVCAGLDSLYFVAQDGIYTFSNDGITNISNSEIAEDIRLSPSPKKITAVFSGSHSLVFFLFPDVSGVYTKIWVYNAKVKGWGKLILSCDFVGETVLTDELTLADFTADSTTIGDLALMPLRFLNIESQWDKTLFFGRADDLYYLPIGSTGEGSSNGVIVTPDYDFDYPDRDKTFSQIAVKLSSPAIEELTFTVDGNNSYGRPGYWKSFGVLTIPLGESEGKVNGRITGSIARFRLTKTSSNTEYTITEMTLRVKNRGRENRYV